MCNPISTTVAALATVKIQNRFLAASSSDEIAFSTTVKIGRRKRGKSEKRIEMLSA